jgi:hypothetical protein
MFANLCKISKQARKIVITAQFQGTRTRHNPPVPAAVWAIVGFPPQSQSRPTTLTLIFIVSPVDIWQRGHTKAPLSRPTKLMAGFSYLVVVLNWVRQRTLRT